MRHLARLATAALAALGAVRRADAQGANQNLAQQIINQAQNAAAGAPAAVVDLEPPSIELSGIHVLDNWRRTKDTLNTTYPPTQSNISIDSTPWLGIFVDQVNITFKVPFNGTKADGSFYTNTTIAEARRTSPREKPRRRTPHHRARPRKTPRAAHWIRCSPPCPAPLARGSPRQARCTGV